jgi:hypothetical protein
MIVYGSQEPPTHVGSTFMDFSALKIEAIRSSETSFHIKSTWCHIQKRACITVTAVKTSNLT